MTAELARRHKYTLTRMKVSTEPDGCEFRDEGMTVPIFRARGAIQDNRQPSTTVPMVAPSSSQHFVSVARRTAHQLHMHIAESTITQQLALGITRQQTRRPTGDASAFATICRTY